MDAVFDLQNKSALEAQAYVNSHLHAGKGISCPCCSQYAKVYSRKLNSNMGRFLISLIRCSNSSTDGGWVHYSRCKFRGRDYNYLDVSYFALAEQRTNEDTDKRRSGFWRPTQRGIDFVGGNISVPRHAYVYNGRLLGFSDEQVDIITCLGIYFSYEELMNE